MLYVALKFLQLFHLLIMLIDCSIVWHVKTNMTPSVFCMKYGIRLTFLDLDLDQMQTECQISISQQ